MDLNELDRRLQRLGADHQRLEKLRRDEQAVQAQLREARQQRREWQQAVEAASDDLRKLEGVSLTALFVSLFGDRKLRIHDEQERLVQAKLRHDECDAAIGPLEQSMADVRAQIEAIGDLGATRRELLASKEKLLRERGGDAADRLIASADELGRLQAEVREIDEAVAAGRRVLHELTLARSELGGASSWGVIDMVGGGPFVSIAKHGRIDGARRHVEAAQRHLRDFVRELGDVQSNIPAISIDIGQFARFADVFFDSLIADWFVQSRIRTATDRVREAKDRVQDLVFALERRRRELVGAEAELTEQRRQWIEQAS